MKAKNNITIGTDVEFALYDIDNKRFIPADENLINMGVKKSPVYLGTTSTGNEVYIERDVVNAEFTFKNTYSLDEADKMWKDINEAKEMVEHQIHKATGLNIELPYTSFVEHDYSLLASKPEKKYFERGCDPDIDAWTNIPNVINSKIKKSTKYGCGFHIHIGFQNPEELKQEYLLNLIKLMDYYIGQYSILYDTDSKRRIESGYGKSGSFRIKPYGVEYRVLGTGFISEKSIKFLFEKIQQALNDISNSELIEHLSLNSFFIQTAINNYNKNSIFQ